MPKLSSRVPFRTPLPVDPPRRASPVKKARNLPFKVCQVRKHQVVQEPVEQHGYYSDGSWPFPEVLSLRPELHFLTTERDEAVKHKGCPANLLALLGDHRLRKQNSNRVPSPQLVVCWQSTPSTSWPTHALLLAHHLADVLPGLCEASGSLNGSCLPCSPSEPRS